MNPVKANIGKLYVMISLQESFFIVGVLFPFLQENGISNRQFFLLQAAFSLTYILLQVPSGYLSDRWGRKNTLIVGALGAIAAILLYATGKSFSAFLAAEVLLAVWASFVSGTAEALIYESMDVNENGRYRIRIGNMMACSWSSQIMTSLLSGILATIIGLRAIAWLTLPFMVAALCVALTLHEPRRHRLEGHRHVRTMFRVAAAALGRAPLRTVVLLGSVLSAMTFAMVWITQSYQQSIHFPLEFFGVPNAVSLLLIILMSQVTSRLEKRIDDRLLFAGIVAVVVLSLLLLSATHGMIGILILLIGRAAYGAIRPLVTDLVTKMTTTETRATVLSLNGFAEKLFFAVSAPMIGTLADLYSLNAAIFAMAVLGGFVAVMELLQILLLWEKLPQ